VSLGIWQGWVSMALRSESLARSGSVVLESHLASGLESSMPVCVCVCV
jgi:hypothetical protein